MSEPLTLDDVSRFFDLMDKHGVVEAVYRGLKVRRMADATGPTRPAAVESELERLKKLPPDSLDAALMLRRNKGSL